MSKDNQLTWYLNVVEFGPRIYGLRAASKYYFNQESRAAQPIGMRLTHRIAQRPVSFLKWLKSRQIPAYFAARRDTIVAGVTQWGICGNSSSLMNDPVTLSRERSSWGRESLPWQTRVGALEFVYPESRWRNSCQLNPSLFHLVSSH